MSDITSLVEALRDSGYPPVSLGQLLRFSALASRLCDSILLVQPANFGSQNRSVYPILSPAILEFLHDATHIPYRSIPVIWQHIAHSVWEIGTNSSLDDPPCLYAQLGHSRGITYRTIFPPTHYCESSLCKRSRTGRLMLKKTESNKAMLFTMDHGAVPVYAIHLRCEVCNINYHHNYRVFDGERTYYPGIPDILQIGEHQFAERRLVELWVSMMVLSWTSATNCARIYNSTHTSSSSTVTVSSQLGWQFKLEVTSDQVYTAFIILSLLEDSILQGVSLVVPHTGTAQDRFAQAMQLRNDRFRLCSQPVLRHYCKKCTRFYPETGPAQRKVSVVKFAIPLEPVGPFAFPTEKETQREPDTGSEAIVDSAIQQSPFNTIPAHPEISSEEETKLRSRRPTLAITPLSTDEGRPPTINSGEGITHSPLSTVHTLMMEDNQLPPPRALNLAKKFFTGLILVFVLPALAAAVVAVALPPLFFAVVLVLVLAFVIVIPLTLLLPFLASMQIGAIGKHPEEEVESKLPMLYAPPISTRSTNLMLAVTMVCATVFGGMHLIAWNFRFPTGTEELLWRISAIALTVLPLIYFIYHVSQRMLVPYRDWIRSRHATESQAAKRFIFAVLVGLDKVGLALVWSTLFLLGIPLYSLARLYVLVEAFIALRDPTPGIFLAVNWIKFVPHL